MNRPIPVIPLAIAIAVAISLCHPAKSLPEVRDYYGPSNQRVTPGRYEEMVEQWYRCLEATETPAAFHECLDAPPPAPEEEAPESSGRVIPLLGPGPDEAEPPADPEAGPGEHDAIAEPERADPPAVPAAGDEAPPAGDVKPPATGVASPEAPTRVIEHDIPIPGGGTMTVKEYQYD